MGRQTSAVQNYQLTAYAAGYMNDLAQTLTLAERLAPSTPVPGSVGQFKIFDDRNSFQVYNTTRVMGGDPVRVEFGASDGTYSCAPQALEITIDKEERRQAGEGNALAQQLLDQGKIKALLNLTALAHVNKTVTAVLDAVSAVSGRGNWSNPDVDPIDQLDEQLNAIATVVGSTQNLKLDMDLGAWITLRNHPKVKARTNGVQVGGISQQQLNQLLAIPVDFMVSSIVKNTAQLGQTVSKARVLASEVLIYYSLPNPTLYDPSAFKTFVAGLSSLTSVRSYMAPNGFYDGHVVDWSEDIKQTSSAAIKRLTIT